jgi:outer membrane protein TolC
MMRNRLLTAAAAAFAIALTPALMRAQQTSSLAETSVADQVRQAALQAATPAPATGAAQTQAPPDTRPVVQLTLDDAIALALERNLDIAVQRLNPQLSDIAIASARAVYSPNLTSTVGNQSSSRPPTSQLQLSQGGGGVSSSTLTYNGGLTKTLPWSGASVALTLNNNRQSTNSNNAFYNPSFQSTWTAEFQQPLLRGFKTDSARQQIAVTKINRDISDIQLKATITNTVSNVRNAYWDFVFATQAVDVARQSLDLADKLVADNQTRVEIGTMAPIDVVQARSEQATRRQALVTAQSTQRTTELALKRLIVSGTDDPNWSARLDPVDQPEFQPETVDVDEAVRNALSQRTDLEIAKKNLEVNDVTLAYLRDQTRPQANLVASYSTQGVGGPYLKRSNTGVLGSTVTETIPGGISDALDSLFRNRYPNWNVQVQVNYPLGFSAQEASVQRARVQLQQVEAQMKQIELQVATDVTNAAIQVQNTAEAVQAAQAARALSQERLDAEQSKFEVGMSTNYFVVQAQRDLRDAQNSELRAILNYRKALVELERLQQTALGNSGITILGR